jgi:hypothetical protein
MTFIVLEKAYDSIPRPKLWQAMTQLNVQEKRINLFQGMYSNTKAHIKIGNTLTESTNITKGLKHGSRLSSLLFIIYTEQVLEMWSRIMCWNGC